MAARMKVGVLISGRGSNLKALLAAAEDPAYPAEIALVLSDKRQAAGLDHAKAAGVATAVIEAGDHATREAFDAAMTERLEAAGVTFVCLAGFMRILGPGFVDHWRDRAMNIHPSLLPLFPGLETHARALAAGVKLHGCTVHLLRAEMDAGPIVGQAAVPVLAEDDAESLAARVLAAEHRLYPTCLKRIAEGGWRIEGERVLFDEAAQPEATLFNPPPAS